MEDETFVSIKRPTWGKGVRLTPPFKERLKDHSRQVHDLPLPLFNPILDHLPC